MRETSLLEMRSPSDSTTWSTPIASGLAVLLELGPSPDHRRDAEGTVGPATHVVVHSASRGAQNCLRPSQPWRRSERSGSSGGHWAALWPSGGSCNRLM